MSNHAVAGEWIVAEGLPGDRVRAVSTLRGSPPVEALSALPLLRLEQVHGCEVVSIDASNRDDMLLRWPRADGAVTRLSGIALAIRTADCLPVVFSDDAGDVVAAAHAGWRGLAAGILEATVRGMQVDPASVRAWIGPGIGPGALEVGEDVFDAFVRIEPSDRAAFAARAPGKWLADLPRLARARLARAGVRRIGGGGWCTYADPVHFHSWRRDRTPERMTTSIWRHVEPDAR